MNMNTYKLKKEWIHMFSVVGDLGAAMELGAEKDQLELQLEARRSQT